MHIALIVVGIGLVIAFWLIFARSRVAPTFQVLMSDIPRVLAQLETSTVELAFAVFVFSKPDRPGDEGAVNIQFSMENGTAGIDWVLLARRNIEDQASFVEFARQRGFSPVPHEQNDVKYLRVEHGDIAKLCQDVMREMYRVTSSTRIELITEGFDWVP